MTSIEVGMVTFCFTQSRYYKSMLYTINLFYTVNLFTSLHFRSSWFTQSMFCPHPSCPHSPRLTGLFHKLMFYILTFTIPLFIRSYYFRSMFYTVDVLLPYYVLQGQRLTSRRFAQAFYAVHGLPSIFSTSTLYKVHVLF